MNRRIVCGDIHGQTAPVENIWRRLNKEVDESDVLILLGDCGLNYFFNYRDDNTKKKLKKFGFTYFCIRGNHEERPENCAAAAPENWHKEEFFGNEVWVQNKYPYIKYALDQVAEYNIDGKSTLVVPGAYSVDKEYRLRQGWSWFPQEQLSWEEQEDGLKNLKSHYDYILSHTCPQGFLPYIQDLFLSVVDQSSVDKTTENYLQTIAERVNWDHWYFGHYHDNRDIGAFNTTMLMHQELPLGESYRSQMAAAFMEDKER